MWDRKNIKIIMWLSAIFLMVLVFWVVLKPMITDGKVTMPNLVGKNIVEANRWCSNIGKSYTCVLEYDTSDEYAIDTVMEQSVRPGTRLIRSVKLTISKGQAK